MLLSFAAQAAAIQTFPDPFAGQAIITDIRAGSTGRDIGDAFLLRDGDILHIRMQLDPPNSFIESHVCVSGAPFTERIPPGQCQFQASGAASGSYDIALPPSNFPNGTTPFIDPLGPFCAQIHISYSAPGLARTSSGGGSAFAGWVPGQPFFGNLCFPQVPDPQPPGDPTVVVTKTGALAGADVTFTVTVENPTGVTAPDVSLTDTLPAGPTWTVPSSCTTPVGGVTTCDLGDIAGGDSVELEFIGTLAVDQCGALVNSAEASIGGGDSVSNDTAVVDVECPPDPVVDPEILMTKVPTTTSVAVPGEITYLVTVENVGPGPALNVSFIDELPPGPAWSLGSGENVCDITGSTLTCAVPVIPDGVFEVLEIVGAVDGSFCGVMDNSADITWDRGQGSDGATADAGEVTISGCAGPATGTPTPSSAVDPGTRSNDPPSGSTDEGELPNTSMAARPPTSPLLLIAAALTLGWLLAPLARRARRLR